MLPVAKRSMLPGPQRLRELRWTKQLSQLRRRKASYGCFGQRFSAATTTPFWKSRRRCASLEATLVAGRRAGPGRAANHEEPRLQHGAHSPHLRASVSDVYRSAHPTPLPSPAREMAATPKPMRPAWISQTGQATGHVGRTVAVLRRRIVDGLSGCLEWIQRGSDADRHLQLHQSGDRVLPRGWRDAGRGEHRQRG